MKTQIAIVDDHLLIAKAIGSVIESFGDYEILYEADNGKSLIEKLQQQAQKPDLILLDISMPEMDGYETALWLSKNEPTISFMALTMQDDNEALIKMIRNGASGYLHKNVHPTELQNALNSVLTKGYYYPDWAPGKLIHALIKNETPESQLVHITEREKEFLGYSCTELTYKEIALKMFCSPRTVEAYRDALFEKLGVKTRVALALYAVKLGLYKP